MIDTNGRGLQLYLVHGKNLWSLAFHNCISNPDVGTALRNHGPPPTRLRAHHDPPFPSPLQNGTWNGRKDVKRSRAPALCVRPPLPRCPIPAYRFASPRFQPIKGTLRAANAQYRPAGSAAVEREGEREEEGIDGCFETESNAAGRQERHDAPGRLRASCNAARKYSVLCTEYILVYTAHTTHHTSACRHDRGTSPAAGTRRDASNPMLATCHQPITHSVPSLASVSLRVLCTCNPVSPFPPDPESLLTQTGQTNRDSPGSMKPSDSIAIRAVSPGKPAATTEGRPPPLSAATRLEETRERGRFTSLF